MKKIIVGLVAATAVAAPLAMAGRLRASGAARHPDHATVMVPHLGRHASTCPR